jgi:cytochrome c5
MSKRTIALSVLGLIAVLAVVWVVLLRSRSGEVAVAAGVSGGGVTLVSDQITLPEDTAALPAGSDLITANCTACHSAEMIATQPVLGAEKWQATIDKMRTVYKAPIAPTDDKALIAALTALPSQQAAAPAAR